MENKIYLSKKNCYKNYIFFLIKNIELSKKKSQQNYLIMQEVKQRILNYKLIYLQI